MATDDVLTPAEVQGMAEEAEAATEGPWRTPGPTETKMAPVHSGSAVLAHVGSGDLEYEENDANARHIAQARTDLPRLAASHEALRRRVVEVLEKMVAQGSEEYGGGCHWGGCPCPRFARDLLSDLRPDDRPEVDDG